MRCRACDGTITPVVDLGAQPAGGRFPAPDDPIDERLPLRLGVCVACGLAQLADPSPPERDEPGGPSPLSSATMSAHARSFVADLEGRGLATPASRILSVASHGGHLAPFLAERGFRATVLASPEALSGMAPGSLDLVVDSYLLAHLERPRDAIAQLAALLAPGGSLVLEFDHLLATVEGRQWDAIRHGHQSYLSLAWVARELAAAGLDVTGAAVQPVYGGALRVYATAGRQGRISADGALPEVLEREALAGIDRPAGLEPLGEAIATARREVVGFLRAAAAAGRPVVGYGAPARSVTFLNALEIGPVLLPYTVDRAPSKQGRTIPGVGVPIRAPQALADDRPAVILVLAWDLAREIVASLESVVPPDTTFRVALPSLAEIPRVAPAAVDPEGAGDVR